MVVDNLFTVIIPTKRIDKFIKIAINKCIELYPNISIIVITNDKSRYKNCKVIKTATPNLSIKRNIGVEQATTKYIVFLDSDAYPLKGWLEAAKESLEKKICGIVGGPHLEYKELGLKQTIQYIAHKSFLINTEPSSLKKSIIRKNTLASSNFAFSKKKFIEVGKLNPNIYTGEDNELCYKFIKAGYINYFNPKMCVCHKQRNLIGFIKQRFVWGRSFFTVLKYTFPYYLYSIIPFLGFLTYIILAFVSPLLFLFANIFYLLFVLLESLRISKNIFLAIKIYPYLALSLFSLGAGTFYSIFKGDIKNDFSSYNNNE